MQKSVKHIKQRRTSSKRAAAAFTTILEWDLSGNEINSYFVSVHITYFSFYSFLYIFSTAYQDYNVLTYKSVFYTYLFSFTPTSPKKETIIVLILPEGNVVTLNEFLSRR